MLLRVSALDDEEYHSSRPRTPGAGASRRLFSPSVSARDLSGAVQSLSALNSSTFSTQERLHSLLGKYEDQGQAGRRRGGGGVEGWRDEEDESQPRGLSPCRVKFKPPVPCLRQIPGIVRPNEYLLLLPSIAMVIM